MALTKLQRKLARLAGVLHATLAQQQRRPTWHLPTARWEQVAADLQRLQQAVTRGWPLAVESQATYLTGSLRHLTSDLISLQGHLAELPARKSLPSPHEIYEDLVAMEQEFDEVAWHGREQQLSVTTVPIELEGVYLGAFRIELSFRDIHHDHPFSVAALDPHPAARNEAVTHPHVNDGVLCEGEGRGAIRAALRGGRLFDFFQIVSNILHTYNADGPYIALDDWHGASCADCDSTIDGESYTCSHCSVTLCPECERSCHGCSDSLCSECTSSCDLCGDTLCSDCTHYCGSCDRGCCTSCLSNNERCQDCHAKEATSAPPAAAAI